MNDDPGTRLVGHALDDFLTLGITAHLACMDDRGWPYIVPVWHQWDGTHFWVIGAKNAAWVRYLRREPRAALSVDEPETLRRVLVQGRSTILEGPSTHGDWQAIARQMASRYLGDEAVAGYETATFGLERFLIRIDVDRLVTWHGPGRSEGERPRND